MMTSLKVLLKKSITCIVRAFTLIISPKFVFYFKYNVWEKLYSEWIKTCFKRIGKETIIERLRYLVGGQYIEIGSRSRICRDCILTVWDTYNGKKTEPYLSIGCFCHIGEYAHITCRNKIIIGNGVLTGRWCTITDNSHGNTKFETLTQLPIKRELMSKGPVVIQDNVWIGDKVTILPNVTIGTGSVVGANSVVTKDIPPYSVACGNPARVVKTEANKDNLL